MEQSNQGKNIGELLAQLGVVRPDDLLAFPGLEASLADPEEALQLAAGVRQRLGELLTDATRLTEEQVAQALDEQTKTGEKLGDMLVRLGYLSAAERDIIVEFQRHQGGEAPTSGKLRLGQILLSTGQISESELTEALERTKDTGRRIGEELVAAGILSGDLLDRTLALQRRLVIAASIAALSPVSGAFSGHAQAAEARAFMAVTATVVDSVSIRSVHQAKNLVITPQDVERGYVEVPGGSRFEIRNKRPCLFEFRAVENIFRSVKVTGLQGTTEFGSDGALLLQGSFGNGLASVEVGYRFELAPGVSPGAYNWPLSLTVLPL